MMHAFSINYWGVLVCGVASMVLGYLWYGPVFGKMWMEMMGWDTKNTAKMQHMKKNAQKGYVIMFIGSLVMAWVLAHMLVFANGYLYHRRGVSAGLMVGFLSWLGFVAPVTLGGVLWEGKSWKLWCFNNAYYLVQLLMFGIILSM